MKYIIFFLAVSHSGFFFSQALAKEEKSLEITATVTKMVKVDQQKYKLELAEYAAVYYASKNVQTCLLESINLKKSVRLKVGAFSLNVLECKINK